MIKESNEHKFRNEAEGIILDGYREVGEGRTSATVPIIFLNPFRLVTLFLRLNAEIISFVSDISIMRSGKRARKVAIPTTVPLIFE